MDYTQNFFISVLRFYLTGEGMLDHRGVDWQSFCRLSRIHHVEGIIYAALKKAAIIPPGPEKARLQKGYLAAIYSAYVQGQAFGELSKMLDEKGIPYMPFKGLVIRDAYPDPALRTMGDMDILVHGRDREKCYRILTGLGYDLIASRNEWLYAKGTANFEIHDRIVYAKDIKNIFDISIFNHVWENAQKKEGTFLCKPDIQDHYALLLTHMAKHAIAGFGIRMVLDIAVWQRRYQDSIDPDILITALEKCKILNFSKNIFAFCEFYFGVTPPINTLVTKENTSKELGEFILENGTFGRDNLMFVKFDRYVTKKYLARPKTLAILNRMHCLIAVLFPAHAYLAGNYQYLKKRPILLPIAWVQRGFTIMVQSPRKTIQIILRMICGKHAKILEDKIHHFGL